MTDDLCPTCGATLTVRIPAGHVPAATPTGAAGQRSAPTVVPPILMCRHCDEFWVRHGVRLDRL